MKKLLSIMLSMLLISSVTGCSSKTNSTDSGMKDGTYSSTQQGFGGEVSVTLTIANGKIETAELVGDNETENVGKAALSTLSDQIIEKQSAEIDGVSGATVTSNAVKAGIQACLDEANGKETGTTEAKLQDGTYTASAWGFSTNKELTVEVTIAENKMTSIDVTDSGDTDIILNTAIEYMIPQMIENQSVKVDSTTGATTSSNAIKMAVEDCLKQSLSAAGSEESAISAFYTVPAKKTDKETIDTDILVVGMGGSGMVTATRAAEALYKANGNDASKVSVLSIDKAAKYGGTSVTTTSPMSINPSYFVEKNNGEEYVDADELKAAWMEYTEGDAKEFAIDYMMEESGPAVDWLIDNGFVFGAPAQGLSAPYKVCVNYGDQFAIPKNVTQTYFDKLYDTYTSYGGKTMLQVEGRSLITNENGDVVGVNAVASDGTEYTINAKKVVLACGGFAGSGEMEDKYLSDEYYNLSGGGRYNLFGMAQNDGKMMQSAIDNGAATYNIGMPPISHIGGAYMIMHEFPIIELDTMDIWTGRNATQSLNDIPMMMAVAPNCLAVNRKGVRFADETTLAAYKNWGSGAYYYTIWSSEQIKNIEENGMEFDTIGIFVNQGGWPSHVAIPEIYDILKAGEDMGYIYEGNTIEELAEKIGVDPSTLANTVADYNEYIDTGVAKDGIEKADVIYGIDGSPLEGDYSTKEKVEGDGPYYAVKGSPWLYSTIGGLYVDEDLQVLDTNGNKINGLYAVGTDCEGVLFTEKKEYVTYGGADQGWAFTSGYILGPKLAEEISAE